MVHLSGAGRILFHREKWGGLSPCIDYRGLSAVTVKYAHLFPLVLSAIEQLCGVTIFIKLDLRSTYNLVRIRAGDEWKTAFGTSSGHYQYHVMAYGLANVPSYFLAFMNDEFRDILGRFIVVYLDDILVYLWNYTQHVQHMCQVLARLLHHHLYAKAEKCEFHKTEISFLGYRIAMEQDKLSVVTTWPVPWSVRELQQFLSFADFCRQFTKR